MPRTVTALFFIILLSACGQSGDLYLPDEKGPDPAPATSSAPADSAEPADDATKAEAQKDSR